MERNIVWTAQLMRTASSQSQALSSDCAPADALSWVHSKLNLDAEAGVAPSQ